MYLLQRTGYKAAGGVRVLPNPWVFIPESLPCFRRG